ncbi:MULTISPECIES: ABC transporter ATP-binding protein [Saccharopolyspora]|uniref:Sn-glycerol-3-phosphate ABC transporter ATP-binding protein UgpC n=1 Tax=Saccharopolyspora gregorii TaxID=33914 RepID=A0ABP6RYP5_9PSEU|nr:MULTISPECIES: sn-glycerol-3-phosphate ABC transporter ATP-binding protein UgpC [Saccharopolyspora]MCA1189418.1 sn-glycerol-3-phosphate ABC transporter ATP-binding protein UgpC [Saccharopolyspora sp. 6T]
MSEVAYVQASRLYPGNPPVRAVNALDLQIDDGEFLVLVGPSGSGKSTALRMLAGLEEVDEGAITIGGQDVTNTPPKARDIAMVFQSYALYPHMTVADNMGFALKLRKTPKDEIRAKVTEAAKMLDLEKYLDRKPKALSGGQRQRVAMGRAIVREPSVFLMDEPLSNLDAKLRVETRANIAALQKRLATTTIYVTHDQVEAMTMGHRVAVLKDGLLQQVASPRELYENPRNAFVAGFIGSPAMNLKTVPLSAAGAELDGQTIPLPRAALSAADGLQEVTFGVRPEALSLVSGEDEKAMTMTVELVEELGADALVHGSIQIAGEPQRFVVRTDGRTPPALGQQVKVALRDSGEVHLFRPDDGTRLTS